MKKSLKKFIWDNLDNGVYITDQMVANFYSSEEASWNYVEELKRRYYRYQADKKFAETQGEIVKLHKGHRRNLIEYTTGLYYCGEDYYKEIERLLK